jgi:KaiC/GvpD/RAD55 family RecA-like ATPase
MDLFTIPAAYAGAAASTVTTTRDLIATNSSALAASPKQESDKVVYQGNQDKRLISIILDQLRRFETTNLIITFANDEQGKITIDGLSEYACDGVVRFHVVEGEEDFNTVNIIKMRLTKVNRGIFNFNITEKGIVFK